MKHIHFKKLKFFVMVKILMMTSLTFAKNAESELIENEDVNGASVRLRDGVSTCMDNSRMHKSPTRIGTSTCFYQMGKDTFINLEEMKKYLQGLDEEAKARRLEQINKFLIEND